MNALSRFCLTVLLIFIYPAVGQNKALEVRFDDLPNLVRERNGNVTAARQVHSASMERTGYLKRSFLPTLSARTGAESAKVGSAPRENLNFWNVEGRINLFRGGRDKIEEEIVQSRTRASATQANRDFLNELKAARENYWHLAATQALIADLKEAILKNDDNVKGAKRRAGAGVTTGADGVQFELENTILVQDLKKLEQQEDVLKNRLSVLIGHNDHKNLGIDPKFPHPPEAEFQEKDFDMGTNPEVNILREHSSIESLRAKQAARWYVPKLDVYARFGLPSLGEDYTLAIRNETEFVSGVSLTLDLGQVFQDRVVERAQGLEASALSSRATQLSNTLRASSHELQHDLRLLHELIHDADRDVQKAQEFLRLTKSEYARGVKNGPDLLEAFSKLYGFRKRKIELNLEYQLAKSEFESLGGKNLIANE